MTDSKERFFVMSERICGMLGLAMRAGKLVVGSEQVAVAVAKGRVLLVIASDEASEGTKKKLRTKCEYYGIKLINLDIGIGELGRILGKTYAPACVGVTDGNFVKAIEGLLEPT